MDSLSKQLIHFTQTQFDQSEEIHFSPESIKFIRCFINEMIETEIKIANMMYKFKYDFIKNKIPKSDNFRWIDNEHKNIIKNTPSITTSTTFNFKSKTTDETKTVEINMIFFDMAEKDAKSYAEHILKQMLIWLIMSDKYVNQRCSQNLKIYIYFTDLVKILPSKPKEIIGSKNVNTAFTMSCKPINEIHIYRKEEWFKAFIHETFHALGLDFSSADNEKLKESKKEILELFKINSKVNLYESYAEIWAELIHLIFILSQGGKQFEIREKKIDRIIGTLTKCISYEQTFSIFQSTKILHHFGLTYQEIITKKCNDYKENTSILSYYILKSIGLSNIDDFICWCVKNNGIENPINFNISEQNIGKYAHFFREHYQKQQYLNKMKQMEIWFSSLPKKQFNRPELKTLKMTML
jgi:hypothetical protein